MSPGGPGVADGDIAVVGMAGRFPGARNVDEFWANVREGRESITELSDDDLRRAGVPERLLADPRYVKSAPLLEGMECFDAAFFGIAPRDAAIMDPQHRQFLECVWEAFEQAAHPPERFGGSIGVFAGAGAQSYLVRNVSTHASLVEAVGSFLVHYTGNEKDVLATRASYQFDLTGPSITVQTACSTSLVAIHLACQSLLNRETDMAVAGGVTIWVPHRTGYLYREGEIRSRDGRCRPFDAAADGTTFGSGVGVVVLRRLADALADRDCVYGVIKGSAVNNDGSRKVGYFAPSVRGQALAVAEALAAAGVDPETIGLVEAHGTGTRIGDPIEIAALSEAYRASTAKRGYCAIGSVKANVGHLDTAAGVAGVIKVVQALVHKQLPPSANFRTPNPAIDFAASPFYVSRELQEWKASGGPRRAAVNSLGIGGTNAHAILEEAPPRPPGTTSRAWQLLVLSARNRTVLERTTDNLARYIEQHAGVDLADVAYTLQVGRSAFAGRRIAVCRDPAEAARILTSRERGRVETETCAGEPPGVAFLFTGQGAQYVDMGRGLYETEPRFREEVDRCAAILRPHLGRDLREVLYPDGSDREAAARALRETATAQPALFTLEFALASLWRQWGIAPRALLGHSLGEYVAACLSGVFTLEDALGLVALRGRLMQALPHGRMLAVLRGEREVTGWLRGSVSLAAVNAPEVCVVSGPATEVEALGAHLTEQGVLCRPLPVAHAFHSAMMEPIVRPFTDAVRNVRLSPPRIPFASNVSGQWITDAQAVDPSYWGVEHVRKAVRFADGLRCITAGHPTVLLEVGPGTSLTALARRTAAPETARAFASSLPNPGDATGDLPFLLASLGRLWSTGVEVDWSGFHGAERRNRVALPTYPFEPVRHWMDPIAEVERGPDPAAGERPPLWFYQPSWKRSLPPLLPRADGAAGQKALVAVFADGGGLGDRVAARLRQQGHPVLIVRPARAFAEHGGDELAVDPGSSDDMERVVDRLSRAKAPTGYLVHLWNLTAADPGAPPGSPPVAEEDAAFFGLLHLARAFAQRQRSHPVHLTLVSSGMQQVAGEPLSHPTRALLLGPCRTIPRELPGFTCRSVDVTLPAATSWQWTALIDSLAAEALCPGGDEVVAYRGGERLTETFERVGLPGEGARESPIREHGTYLVTGGTGGIGLAIADHLIRRAAANVVLVGRTHFPSQGAGAHPMGARIRELRELAGSGGSLSVLGADVADARQVRDAVRHALDRFGALHGVFHLAGVLDDGLIALKTRESAERVLRPKVAGTRALLAALEGVSLDFIAMFSSLSSIVGLAGQIDYAAANAFLDAVARQQHALTGRRIIAIDWGAWEEVGMVAERFPSAPDAPKPERRSETRIVEVGATTHWVIDEHRRKDGVAVMPGTGYIEFARATFVGDHGWSPVELRDVFFLSPMPFHGDERRKLRIELERGEPKTRFSLSSSPVKPAGENGEWDLHATGAIMPVLVTGAGATDLTEIVQRCPHRVALARREPAHAFWSFGPRWASLTELRFGRAEAVMVLEMPREFTAELDEFPLHPALLDMATGELVTQFGERGAGTDGGDLFVPFSYGALRCYRPLVTRLYCHVRYRQPSLERSPVATFDVTITDERGEILVEVEEFVMRRTASQGRGLEFGERPAASREAPRAARDAGALGPGRSLGLFRQGIRPAQGIEALEHILARAGIPQIVVSPASLDEIRAGSVEASGPAGRRGPAAEPPPAAAPGDVESLVMALWKDVLGVDDIRPDDDFFALGGHSLSLVQAAAQLRTRLRIDLPMSALIEQTTVGGWTRAVEDAMAAER